MPIDPGIILGIKSPAPIQIADPMELYGKSLTLRNLLGQSQMNELKADEYRRGVDRNKRLEALLGSNPQNLESALTQGGFLDEALKVGKDRREGMKTEAETGEKKADTVSKTLANYKALLPRLSNPQQVAEWTTAQFNDPVLAPVMKAYGSLDKALATIPQDPAEFQKWRFNAEAGMEKVMADQRAKEKLAEDIRNNKEQNRASMITAGAAATNAATNRARLEHDKSNDSVQYMQTPEGIVAVPKKPGGAPTGQIVRDAQGKPLGGEINKEAATRLRDAKDVLGILDQAEKILPNATGSYAGKGVDMLGNLVGASTEGGKNAAELKVLSGALVSKMPKMSGPQSDKDVMLYREMAGQIGDETLPVATRQAALRTVRALNQKYAGENQGPSVNDIPGQSTPQTFNSMPDPASLNGRSIRSDDGTIYKSDGKRWVKQ